MRNEDFEIFAQRMVTEAEVHRTPLTPALIELYFRIFTVFTLEQVFDAFDRHMLDPDSGRFFPKPADLAKYLRHRPAAAALEAWSKVAGAIRSVGSYQSVAFDDPLIHAVIQDMGGWARICAGEEDEACYKAREFERRYVAYTEHPPMQYPAKLIGRFEADNQAKGLKTQAPQLIGDSQRALTVLESGQTQPKLQITSADQVQSTAHKTATGLVLQMADRKRMP